MYIQKDKKELIKKFYKINKDLYRKGKDPLKCHGPDHHMRVWKYALYLTKALEKRGKKIDYEILIPACFLHDITAYNSQKSEKDHWNHQDDVEAAMKVLRKIKYPKDKISKITQAISVHSTNTKHIDKNEPIETTILRDADKMDVFGPLGITRIIMALSRRKYSIEDVVKIFHDQDNIGYRYRIMKIPEAKRFVKENYKYSREFFKRLNRDLST